MIATGHTKHKAMKTTLLHNTHTLHSLILLRMQSSRAPFQVPDIYSHTAATVPANLHYSVGFLAGTP